jgi:Raf kinase inhibitor-like YbhB/YbcL family protein
MLVLMCIVLLSSPGLTRTAEMSPRISLDEQEQKKGKASASRLEITSPAFLEGEMIPTRHACDGRNVSPPLEWRNAPAGTRSFALVCEDPDAPGGTWVHWVVYDLPPNATRLTEGVPNTVTLRAGGKQGVNDFTSAGYGGPCPPRGKPHRYIFSLYALDVLLELEPGASKEDLMHAVTGHILARAQLLGTYRR